MFLFLKGKFIIYNKCQYEHNMSFMCAIIVRMTVHFSKMVKNPAISGGFLYILAHILSFLPFFNLILHFSEKITPLPSCPRIYHGSGSVDAPLPVHY